MVGSSYDNGLTSPKNEGVILVYVVKFPVDDHIAWYLRTVNATAIQEHPIIGFLNALNKPGLLSAQNTQWNLTHQVFSDV